MNIDPKMFFKNSPRIREEVRIYVNNVATQVLERFLEYAKILNIDNINPVGALLLSTLICSDPITTYQSGNELCVQTCKIIPMQVLIGKAIQETEIACKDLKYGNIDKKLVCQTNAIIRQSKQKYTRTGACCVAACIAEIIGIILNSAVDTDTMCTTLTLEMVEKYGMTHRSRTTGTRISNGSLIRLLAGLQFKKSQPVVKEE